jgi:hypothetical protein
MISFAAANIFRKALALKPDGIDGLMNNLDPEMLSLKNLGGRLKRRRAYLKELSQALNAAPQAIEKSSLTRLVHPLEETVGKIDLWLVNASKSLDGLNKVVKDQNKVLKRSLLDFVDRNKGILSMPKATKNKASKPTKIHFVKAAA